MTTKITTGDSGGLLVSRRRFMQAGAALVTLPFMTTGAGAAADDSLPQVSSGDAGVCPWPWLPEICLSC
ncbi:TPA: hypothetical protein ACSRWF_001036 [Morganella morganii]